MNNAMQVHPASPPSGMAKELDVETIASTEWRSWTLLAVGALAIAGVFAFLLAVSRLPGAEKIFPWPLGFFSKGLVIHVIFSLVVWFLVVFALLTSIATHETSSAAQRLPSLGGIGAGLVAMAFPLLFLPAFLDDTTASLNNYVPVIVHRAYYFGLVLLSLGVALPAAKLLANVPRRLSDMSPLALAMSAGALVYFSALSCAAAGLAMSWGGEPTRQFHENLFWGAGHVLQFLYALMMLTGWFYLLRASLGGKANDPEIFRIAVVLIGVFAVLAPILYAVFEPFSVFQSEAFRRLQMVVALPSLMIAVSGLSAVLSVRRRSELPWRDPAFLALVLSTLVFGAGGIMGFLITGSDTRTPAHYHGVIAGVNLSLMGLFHAYILPALGQPARRPRAIRAQILLFGCGQLIACVGLFLAGGYGAPRKMPSGAVSLVDGAVIGMYLHGVGALIAIIGGVMFVLTIFSALKGRESLRGQPLRFNARHP
jgi:hypothetical protein